MAKKKLILVADQREDSLILFHQVLRRFGYDVVLASSAQETLDQARRHRPDLVLLDLGMAAARLLRSDPTTSRTPLIAVSAEAEPADDGLRAEGFCGVVTRQTKLDALLSAVRACLGGAETGLPAAARA